MALRGRQIPFGAVAARRADPAVTLRLKQASMEPKSSIGVSFPPIFPVFTLEAIPRRSV